MVDFQSRNTRRERTIAEDGDAADEGGAEPETGAGDSDGGDATTAAISAALVTVSDQRSAGNDPAADAVAKALEAAGHDVVTREILRTSHDSVQGTVTTLVDRDDVTAIVTTGGTGVAPRDVTIEAVHPLIDKGLPGFGEEFRRRYAEAVGTDAIATRATGGVAETTPIFCLPGDAEAARIGTSEIVVEQAERLARLASLDEAADP